MKSFTTYFLFISLVYSVPLSSQNTGRYSITKMKVSPVAVKFIDAKHDSIRVDSLHTLQIISSKKYLFFITPVGAGAIIKPFDFYAMGWDTPQDSLSVAIKTFVKGILTIKLFVRTKEGVVPALERKFVVY